MNVAAIDGIAESCVRDAACLIALRAYRLTAATTSAVALAALDERIAALLECLDTQGRRAETACSSVLVDEGEPFASFALMWLSLQRGVPDALERVSAAVEPRGSLALGAAVRGAAWAPRQALRGQIDLAADAPLPVCLASLEACAMHAVDPGYALTALLSATEPLRRARALQAAAEHGRLDLLDACRDALRDDDAGCRYAAACSAVLLGARGDALENLAETAAAASASQAGSRALRAALRAMDEQAGRAWLRRLGDDPAQLRAKVIGAGCTGDPRCVPWLIEQMADVVLARIAGEAFGMLTGCSLVEEGLVNAVPPETAIGPNDDPADANVDLDPDDELPWPDADRCRIWWSAHARRFAAGTRYFLGVPRSVSHCFSVLGQGNQRQRIAAADTLCFLRPGTRLFATAAPMWRQRRWLAAS